MKLSLDDALTNFQAEISPWKNPTEWLQADEIHIQSIIREAIAWTGSIEIEQAMFNLSMIYRRSILYIFMHLMLCESDNRLLGKFVNTLKQWREWDGLTVLQNHHLIRDYLLDRFHLDLQPFPDLHSESVFSKLFALDVVGLCARLTVVVTDSSGFKKIIALRGSGAQSLLDLLQTSLDFVAESATKRRLFKALIKLSRASGLYPECLVLTGIEFGGDAIAGGGFGDVYKGRLQDQAIAIKVLRIYQQSDMEKLLKEFSSEAVTWKQLSHPNVLPFYGVFRLKERSPRLCLVCPWMENGNVVQFLADRAHDTNCVLLSLDIAQGLEYLHSEKIVHGDLKGLNILVSRSRRAFLADFGLATSTSSKSIITTYMSSRASGTLRWQAPELFPIMQSPDAEVVERHETFATDVYAYALVLYEMFSGEYPFQGVVNDFQVIFQVVQGGRPLRPSHDLSQKRGLTDNVWQLIEACWAAEPSERPSAEQIVSQLRALPVQLIDERPRDDFNISLSPLVSRDKTKDAFSLATILAAIREDKNSTRT